MSTKGKYGLVAMVDLALEWEKGHVPLNVIADRQGISVNYLEHLFSSLKKQGIVKSVKGAQGGYSLADHPSKITVGDVLRVLEGELVVAEETLEDNPIERCLTTNLWNKINQSINDLVDQITLEDMKNYYLKQQDYLMYYI
ncbi:RrF2 family transcriptional regulator [Alkaliphilus crotonatoxidans]